MITLQDAKSLAIGVGGSLISAGIVFGVSRASELPPLEVPLWLVAIIIACPSIWFAVRKFAGRPRSIVDGDFSCEPVILDNKTFINCSFDRCELIFNGRTPVVFRDCKFGAPKFKFGTVPANTIEFLRGLDRFECFDAVLAEVLPRNNKEENKAAHSNR